MAWYDDAADNQSPNVWNDTPDNQSPNVWNDTPDITPVEPPTVDATDLDSLLTSIGITPSTTGKWDTPTNKEILTSIGYSGNFSPADISSFFKNLVTTKSGLAQLATLAGGIAAASRPNSNTTPTGYQGKIPTLTASRDMLTAPPVGRRPGSGGIDYGGGITYKDQSGNVVSSNARTLDDLIAAAKGNQYNAYNAGYGLTGATQPTQSGLGQSGLAALLAALVAQRQSTSSGGLPSALSSGKPAEVTVGGGIPGRGGDTRPTVSAGTVEQGYSRNYSPAEIQTIRGTWLQTKNDPAAAAQLMNKYGVTVNDLALAMGEDPNAYRNYFSQAGVSPVFGGAPSQTSQGYAPARQAGANEPSIMGTIGGGPNSGDPNDPYYLAHQAEGWKFLNLLGTPSWVNVGQTAPTSAWDALSADQRREILYQQGAYQPGVPRVTGSSDQDVQSIIDKYNAASPSTMYSPYTYGLEHPETIPRMAGETVDQAKARLQAQQDELEQRLGNRGVDTSKTDWLQTPSALNAANPTMQTNADLAYWMNRAAGGANAPFTTGAGGNAGSLEATEANIRSMMPGGATNFATNDQIMAAQAADTAQREANRAAASQIGGPSEFVVTNPGDLQPSERVPTWSAPTEPLRIETPAVPTPGPAPVVETTTYYGGDNPEAGSSHGYDWSGYDWSGYKAGGLTRDGFVVPADVVSHLGNGSSSAGLALLASKFDADPIRGKGDGMSDSIRTHIDGKQEARVANDEAYISPEMVRRIGGGDVDRGAKKLYAMMEKVRRARTGSSEQGKEINPDSYMPGGQVNKYATGGTTSSIPAAATGSESSLSNWVGPYVTNMLGQGQALANAPYQAYTGPLTAGASPLQQQAFATASGLQTPAAIGQAAQTAGGLASTMSQLGYTPATFGNQFAAPGAYQTGTFTNQFTAPTGAYTPGTFDTEMFGTEQAQRYMNPYVQQVLNPQLREAQRQADINRASEAARMAKAGAYGGSRQAIMEAEGSRNLLNRMSDITGAGYASAYDKAQQAFTQDQARRLQAQQAAEGAKQFGAGQAMTAAQLAAQYGLSADQAREASRQFGAGQGMTAAQLAAQYGLAGQQAGEASRQFGATYGLQGLQSALQAAQAQGNLGIGQSAAEINNLRALAELGGVQRGIESEGIAADKAQFEEARLNPYKMLQFQQSLLSGLPLASQTYTMPGSSNLQQFAQGADTINTLLAKLGYPVKG